LIFIELDDEERVGEVFTVYLGERIRDLEVNTGGTIYATADSGKLLVITPAA
jgi:glucose/arabinose dehydrogenase